MDQIELKGCAGTVVLVRRTARASRLSLRVSSLDGRVTLTLPPGVSNREARRFAEEKADWIANALKSQKDPIVIAPGAELPVEGIPHRVVAGSGRTARLLPEAIAAPSDRAGPAILALMKNLARSRLMAAAEAHSANLGRAFGRMTLRDTRSRWGSCSGNGNLMFSWRLILAPPDVLNYVAAHEVAHLERMDHSPAFWEVVEELCPFYRAPRAWLRQEGASLHRYRFTGD